MMLSSLFSKRDHKLFVPSQHKKGGPATFMRNMKTYLDTTGYPYTEKYKRGDHIFFMIRHDIKTLKKVKKNGGRIVQRLDGVYGPDLNATDYKMRNQRIADVYRNYADWVVFQSDYCKRLCESVLGQCAAQNRTIHNGVDREIFYPAEQSFTGDAPFDFVTSGRFKYPQMLDLILTALDSLRGKFDFRLHIIDQMQHKSAPGYASKDYVLAHGSKDLRGVAELLRQSHIYLFNFANPPCPNAVLEAAASGLPVVSFDSGSMSELLPFNAELLAPVSADLFQRQKNFHADALADKISLAVENYPRFRATALAHVRDYDFAKCGKAYQDVFELATR